jgi:putative ABC transport system permease protein
LDDATQQIVVYAHKPAQSGIVAQKMAALFGNESGHEDTITEWKDHYYIAFMNMNKPMYYVIYLVLLVVACLLIVNTITMIINERIKEIGMMGSLGMTRAEIVRVFFFESVFLAMAGATAGMILGGIVTGIAQFFPISMGALVGSSEIPMSNAIFFNFSLVALAQAWFMGVVVSSVFTLIPSLKSAFVEPVEALRR